MSAFDVYRGSVNAWECDTMGHMNVQHYVARMSHAWSHIRPTIGYPPGHLTVARISPIAVRDVIRYKRELLAGDAMHMTSQVVAATEKTISIHSVLYKSTTGEVSATFDTKALHFDLAARKSRPFPDEIRAKAEALIAPVAGGIELPPETDPVFSEAPEERFFETCRGSVNAWECDYLGHMNVQFYADRLAHAAGTTFAMLRIPRERGIGSAAVQHDVRYLRELRAGDPLHVRSAILAIGNKTLRFGHRLYHATTGELSCTADIVGVIFDLKARKAIPVPDELRRRAEDMMRGKI